MPSVRYVPAMMAARSKFYTRVAGVLGAAVATPAMAQVVALTDLRQATVSARSGASDTSLSISPTVAFGDFETPDPFAAAAHSGAASVQAEAAQSSGIVLGPTMERLWGRGRASASGSTATGDVGSAQSSSSCYMVLRLDEPTRIDLSATLGGGPVSGGQFILQGAGGQVSYFFGGSTPQPIRINRVLPAGQYTIVGYASAAISLYPSATLADGSWFDFTAEFHALCPGDFNRDGFVDGFDYDDFVVCFESGSPACPVGVSADFNFDGFVDGFDYDEYVSAFESACP